VQSPHTTSASPKHIATGIVAWGALVVNVAFWGSVFLLFAAPLVFMRGRLKEKWTTVLATIGDCWATGNSAIAETLLDVEWTVTGGEQLTKEGRYLVMANHLSAIDIFIVLGAMKDAPFIRFFMKRILLLIPIIGVACYALGAPFMRRYSAGYLAKHPEKRGLDLQETKRSCRRIETIPATLLIFVEGTRLTRKKHAACASPFQYLLPPRPGGLSYALASLGAKVDALLDVTVTYPGSDISLWKYLSNRVPRVHVDIRRVPVPAEFLTDAITRPGPARDRYRAWLTERWHEKDRLIATMTSRAS
jgi:1-acyl-sn-glycerol-3-phosphate acyltransferase